MFSELYFYSYQFTRGWVTAKTWSESLSLCFIFVVRFVFFFFTLLYFNRKNKYEFYIFLFILSLYLYFHFVAENACLACSVEREEKYYTNKITTLTQYPYFVEEKIKKNHVSNTIKPCKNIIRDIIADRDIRNGLIYIRGVLWAFWNQMKISKKIKSFLFFCTVYFSYGNIFVTDITYHFVLLEIEHW